MVKLSGKYLRQIILKEIAKADLTSEASIEPQQPIKDVSDASFQDQLDKAWQESIGNLGFEVRRFWFGPKGNANWAVEQLRKTMLHGRIGKAIEDTDIAEFEDIWIAYYSGDILATLAAMATHGIALGTFGSALALLSSFGLGQIMGGKLGQRWIERKLKNYKVDLNKVLIKFPMKRFKKIGYRLSQRDWADVLKATETAFMDMASGPHYIKEKWHRPMAAHHIRQFFKVFYLKSKHLFV